MPKKLTRLRIVEGSLVNRAANPLCRVMLWKSGDGGRLDRAVEALKAELASIAAEEAEEDQAALINATIDDFLANKVPAVEPDEEIEMAQRFGMAQAEIERAMRDRCEVIAPGVP